MGASTAVVHDAHDTSSGKDLNPIVNAWVDVWIFIRIAVYMLLRLRIKIESMPS
jgi:hypothetical protein